MAQAQVIDGKAFAAGLRERIAGAVSTLKEKHGLTPGLAVVLVGEDPASQVYVRNKAKQTVEVGMNSWEHRLDALIAPTNGPAWMTDHVNGDSFHVGSSSLAAVSGYPNITVPAGFIAGLPVGVSFIGPANSEKALIEMAYAFEQARNARRPPEF